ncbi:MAG: hypothetical protein Q7R42_03770 [Candidatus Planktophila sp.]|nr:hypothetical protein [Candidatus Planktophila sp.]
MTSLQLFSVIDIVALIASLAIYLFIVGRQLAQVAGNLEEAADLVWKIKADADLIEPGLERINVTGGIVAGALPLLYGMAEAIVVGATYQPDPHEEREPNFPASRTRRSRMLDGVGFVGK